VLWSTAKGAENTRKSTDKRRICCSSVKQRHIYWVISSRRSRHSTSTLFWSKKMELESLKHSHLLSMENSLRVKRLRSHGSIPADARHFSALPSARQAVMPTQPSHSVCIRGCMTTYLNLFSRLRVSGARPPVPLTVILP